jgi:hypothetical protein
MPIKGLRWQLLRPSRRRTRVSNVFGTWRTLSLRLVGMYQPSKRFDKVH